MSIIIKGIEVSPGIGIGKVFLYEEVELAEKNNFRVDAEFEKSRLLSGRQKAKIQLEEIKNKAYEKFGSEKGAIFDSHITILEDEDLYGEICDLIDEGLSAINALKSGIDMYSKIMANLDDPYLRERAADVKDIGKRWLCNILEIEIVNLSDLPIDTVIVAHDLAPSDTAQIDLENVRAFVTEAGGETSHTSLMARSLELPAVVGTGDIIKSVKNGDNIIVDGLTGNIIIDPSEKEIREYIEKKEKFLEERELLNELKDKKAISIDGFQVSMFANIGSPNDIDGVIKNGAEGIGLYRTEFLFMDKRSFPSEEEQFQAYKKVAEMLNNKPVIIRTMDIGGDKPLPYMEFPHEMNPFLGWRAIRMCLDKPEILKTQLRALLKASNYGNIKIMIPMIIDISEIRKSEKLLDQCKEELRIEGIKFDENISLGIMVETPAVIIRADKFAHEVDFFSIGTNDLTQYILAVDRGNEKISNLYDQFNPSVLKAIKMAIDGAHKEGIKISMCGEFSGNPKATALLLGMGLDEFSMSSTSIPYIKNNILKLNKKDCEDLVKQVLDCDTGEEVIKLIDDFENN
jgi:phosphotransferase system enzyme I (PtsI)